MIEPHPNDMTHWPEIRCQEGHESHATRMVTVDLGKPHGYHDLPLVPERFHRRFDMAIYDHRQYRKATSYCPGHDAVSETIDTHGIWEPAETILTLAALTAERGMLFDFGAQIGWFSALAASCGRLAIAHDAEAENLLTVQQTEDANDWPTHGAIAPDLRRFGPDTQPNTRATNATTVALAKIDVEGAERDVLRYLWPLVEAGRVDHLLVEISPVFADYYPDLVCDLLDVGYRAWQVPEKDRNARPVLDVLPRDLGRGFHEWDREHLRAWIAAQHQFNLWASLPGATFG